MCLLSVTQSSLPLALLSRALFSFVLRLSFSPSPPVPPSCVCPAPSLTPLTLTILFDHVSNSCVLRFCRHLRPCLPLRSGTHTVHSPSNGFSDTAQGVKKRSIDRRNWIGRRRLRKMQGAASLSLTHILCCTYLKERKPGTDVRNKNHMRTLPPPDF